RSLFSKKKCTKKIYLSLNKRHLEKRPLSQPFKIAGFRNLALQLPICSINQRGSSPSLMNRHRMAMLSQSNLVVPVKK
ncbi:hypothetical protein ACEUDR_17490, partial [Aeromonas veronii]